MTRGIVALLALSGCRDSAEDVADRFVEAYFVEASQDRAMRYATGLAKEKLQGELRLVAEVRAQGYTPDQARARVRFFRHTLRLGSGQGQAGYEIMIQASAPAGAGSATRRSAYLGLRREADGWRVSNYEVSETVSPRAPK